MQLAVSEQPSRDHLVRDRLAIATRLLNPPADCEIDILQRASLAAQNVLEAVYASGGADLAVVAPEAARLTAALLRKAAPSVAEAAEGKILPERIYFMLGATSGLLTNSNDPFALDRIDYAAMFAAELAQVHHSRAISQRGFPMLRAARVNTALAAPRDPEKPLA